MAKKVLRDGEKKGAGAERPEEPEEIQEVDPLLVEFGRFTEEASQQIDILHEKDRQLEERMAEIATRLDGITAIVSQLNNEMSKLAGDLYRTANANDTFHREIANLISELARTLPAAIDARLAEMVSVGEGEKAEIEPTGTEESKKGE